MGLSTPNGIQAASAGPLDGFSSDNVKFVKNIPVPTAGGGTKLGDYYYLLSSRGLTIFDASRPEQPKELSRVKICCTLEVEDPSTNGKILLLSETGLIDYNAEENGASSRTATLYVIDVRDKRHPRVIGKLSGAADHVHLHPGLQLGLRWCPRHDRRS